MIPITIFKMILASVNSNMVSILVFLSFLLPISNLRFVFGKLDVGDYFLLVVFFLPVENSL